MKPSWDDAPEWARFVAMDQDGDWYWYENKPELGHSGFLNDLEGGRVKWARITDEPLWPYSVEERP